VAERLKKLPIKRLKSEINWESPVESDLPAASQQDTAVYNAALKEMKSIIEEMNTNERARKDVAGWKRDILVKSRGGRFSIIIDDGDIKLEEKEPASPDFVMACDDPNTLDGLAYRGAITDSAINKKFLITFIQKED